MDKRVLFVVNMQEYYVGKGRNQSEFPYDGEELVNLVNDRIKEYAPEEIYYIITTKKGLFGQSAPKEGTQEAGFPAKLKVISKNIYQKHKPDAFSSVVLEDVCRARMVKEIELVGVDGVDVASTAQGAIDCGISVIFNEKCIGQANMEKTKKIVMGLKKNKISYME